VQTTEEKLQEYARVILLSDRPAAQAERGDPATTIASAPTANLIAASMADRTASWDANPIDDPLANDWFSSLR
jgi:hypothetical protein